MVWGFHGLRLPCVMDCYLVATGPYGKHCSHCGRLSWAVFGLRPHSNAIGRRWAPDPYSYVSPLSVLASRLLGLGGLFGWLARRLALGCLSRGILRASFFGCGTWCTGFRLDLCRYSADLCDSELELIVLFFLLLITAS